MALAACLLLSGCGTGGGASGRGEKEVKAMMNMQEAAEHADAMLDATLAAVKPEIQWAHGPTTAGSCSLSRRRTVMTVVSSERRGSFLGVVERFWRAQNYKIVAVNKNEEFPAVFARTPDNFQIHLAIKGAGQGYFEVDTPCVEESEVAESTSRPNGPAYEGVYPLPRPNVHSDFWSSDTPAPKA
jgi:hypothetical protein